MRVPHQEAEAEVKLVLKCEKSWIENDFKKKQKKSKNNEFVGKVSNLFYCDFVFFTLEGAMHTDINTGKYLIFSFKNAATKTACW